MKKFVYKTRPDSPLAFSAGLITVICGNIQPQTAPEFLSAVPFDLPKACCFHRCIEVCQPAAIIATFCRKSLVFVIQCATSDACSRLNYAPFLDKVLNPVFALPICRSCLFDCIGRLRQPIAILVKRDCTINAPLQDCAAAMLHKVRGVIRDFRFPCRHCRVER